MASLHIDRGDRQRDVIHLKHGITVLGRSPDCDEIISKNEAVSRWHARILFVNDCFYIEDHKASRNGTYVNDRKIPFHTQVPLGHKDVIRICDFEATFSESEDGNSSTVDAVIASDSDHSLDKQPAAKLAALLEITAKLSKTLELDTQLPQVAEGLLRLFPQADRCFLILSEAETGNLQPKVVRTRGSVDESTARFSATIVRQCVQTGQAILLREGDNKIPISSADSVLSANMRSVMCVPLTPPEGKPFGVIQLDTQDGAKRFTEEDLRLLWGVAHQASVAMQNSRFHELRLNQERVKNELEMARQVQLHFLPRRLPELPGYEFYSHYEAAREVGGDYYDFIPMAEQRLAVTVGDVAGKGMPAALLMARLSSETRSCLMSERQLTSAVARLNDQLFPVTSPMDRFITLVLAVLDPASHTVTLVNAGHPPPFWYHRADRKFTKPVPLEDDGQSLGISAGHRYQAYQVKLAPGDSLVLYSDGVIDAQSQAGKPFRMKGIHAVLDQGAHDSPHALGERIVQAVRGHVLGGPQYDDITLLCFGRLA